MIIKVIRILLTLGCCLLSLIVSAQDSAALNQVAVETTLKNQASDEPAIVKQAALTPEVVSNNPQVGKHVMANMDAGSMILSLLMVLGLIIICALVLKRFNLSQQGVSQLKVVTSLSLGGKERVIVIQAGEQQLLLGVTAQQVTLIDRLAEPLPTQPLKAVELPKSLLSFLSAKKS